MASKFELPTRGQVKRIEDGKVVFAPAGTTYELHLLVDEPYTGPIDEPIEAVLRASGRKMYTVPSGGNFIQPIFGPPKIIQGRVKSVNDSVVVVHAGANFVVELPGGDSAIDLNNGRITVGSMLNVIVQPGTTFERAAARV